MASIIQRVIAGDKEGIVLFYKKFSPRISRFVHKKIGNSEDAEEIVNDIFLEAIDHLPKLSKHENLNAWLYAIANNTVIDYYRKNKLKALLFSQLPFLEIVDKEVHQPEFVFEKNKLRDAIEETFHSVSKKYQKILRFYYEENISVKELAQKLHISLKAAESLLFRARQSFKKAYEQS